MKEAVILCGVPGSGKSTRARQLAGTMGVIHSTDEFFMVMGRYVFDPKRLAEAHAWNLSRFTASLERGIPLVICDNTNVKRVHRAPYVEAARKAGYNVRIICLPHPDPEVAAIRNIHGVPLHTIQRMIAEWEPESAA